MLHNVLLSTYNSPCTYHPSFPFIQYFIFSDITIHLIPDLIDIVVYTTKNESKIPSRLSLSICEIHTMDTFIFNSSYIFPFYMYKIDDKTNYMSISFEQLNRSINFYTSYLLLNLPSFRLMN